MRFAQALALAGLLLPSTAGTGAAEPVNEVRVLLPPQAGEAVRHIGGLLARQIHERCPAKVVSSGESAFEVELTPAAPSGHRRGSLA
jgi:hypothetical protein